jgi:type IV pilus assembly protein PilE
MCLESGTLAQRRSGRPAQTGVTLIELMIVVVIVAILAAVVVPSYQSYVMKARRTEAKAALTTVAQLLERVATENPKDGYKKAILSDDNPAPANTIAKKTTENGYYQLFIGNQTETTFTVRAEPQNAQLKDGCKTFTLNQRGERDVAGGASKTSAECWQ